MFGIELPYLSSKEYFDDWPLDAKKLAVDYIKLKVLDGITSIEPKIHRMRFLGFDDIDYFKHRLDSFQIVDKGKSGFKYTAIGKFNGIDIRILFYPEDDKIASNFTCLVYKTFNSHKDLYEFNERIPSLLMSKVEYTLDMLCNDPISTQNLFKLLRRYVYCPRKTATKLYDSDTENSLYYIDTKKRLKKLFHHELDSTNVSYNIRFKIYERGPDQTSKSKRSSWSRESLDRVRIEYTAFIQELDKHKLFNLRNFLESCKFKEIFENSFKFRKFKDTSKKCPKEWDDYKKMDQDGNNNSFQEEYIQSRLQNISQHIIQPDGFEGIQSRFLKAIEKFDKEWKKKYDSYFI